MLSCGVRSIFLNDHNQMDRYHVERLLNEFNAHGIAVVADGCDIRAILVNDDFVYFVGNVKQVKRMDNATFLDVSQYSFSDDVVKHVEFVVL